MRMTAEISMYPLCEDLIPKIDAVIAKLNTYAEIDVHTFTTATTLTGEYEAVMAAISETIAWSYAEHGKAVFVTKFIPGYAPGEHV